MTNTMHCGAHIEIFFGLNAYSAYSAFSTKSISFEDQNMLLLSLTSLQNGCQIDDFGFHYICHRSTFVIYYIFPSWSHRDVVWNLSICLPVYCEGHMEDKLKSMHRGRQINHMSMFTWTIYCDNILLYVYEIASIKYKLQDNKEGVL